MSQFDDKNNEFFDDADYAGYGNRDADTYHALECLEDALNTLACMGSGASVDEVTLKVHRAFLLIDRHYGEMREYQDDEPLDFNEDD
jgi:hypothetical protein